MANEISASLSLSVSNGAYSDRFAAANVKSDQAAQLGAAGVVTVGTAVQTLSIAPVTSAGYAAFRNLNTQTSGTHYVSIGAYVGTNLHEFVALRRGQPAMLPLLGGVTLGAKAYGTATKVKYIVLAE